jgi:hypothetical protein
MHKFTAWRKKATGNQGESIPDASRSLKAVKSAYKKALHPLDAVKLAVMTEIAKASKLY